MSGKRITKFQEMQISSKKKKLSLKRNNITRWSAKYDSIKAFKENLRVIKDFFEEIISSDISKEEYLDSKFILENIVSESFLICISFFLNLVKKINLVALNLQEKSIHLIKGIKLIENLRSYLNDLESKNSYDKFYEDFLDNI